MIWLIFAIFVICLFCLFGKLCLESEKASKVINEEFYEECPTCKGVCGIETAPNDWHDCDKCDATGKIAK